MWCLRCGSPRAVTVPRSCYTPRATSRRSKPSSSRSRASARDMKKFVEIFLGVLTAIGGFVDIGELVANTEGGARFGFALVWPILLGLVVIMLYAEMSGRIATMSKRPVFD